MKDCKNPFAYLLILLPMLCSALTVVAGNRLPVFTGGLDKQLLVDLVTLDAGNAESFVDGMLVRFNSGYLASTADDALKTGKSGENLASYRENKILSEEKRPLFYATDTVFLYIAGTSIRNYRFKITMLQLGLTGLMVRIDDNFLHSSKVLNSSVGYDDLDFSVTADPASADPFRFRIVLITARPLPLTITSFAASQQNKNIALEWKISNQVNVLRYEVERSANGTNFSKAVTVAAIGGSSQTYNWLDEHAGTGNNFYRIRCVGIAGDISYSSIISVKSGTPISGISIYPNPVINNIIALQFTNMPKGSYLLRFLNSMGQVLFTKAIDHNGNNSARTIAPESSMEKGNYYLEISGPGDLKMSKLVLVTK